MSTWRISSHALGTHLVKNNRDSDDLYISNTSSINRVLKQKTEFTLVNYWIFIPR